MTQPRCLVFDPERRLLDRPNGLTAQRTAEYATREALLGALASTAAPALTLFDATVLDERTKDALAARITDGLVLVVVRVETTDEGLSWLSRGALDFIVDEHSDEEITARVGRLLSIGEALWRVAVRDSLVAGYIRRTVHDLRTPLSAVSGLAELLLLDEALPEACREDLNSIHESSLRLAERLDAMAEFASPTERSDPPREARETTGVPECQA